MYFITSCKKGRGYSDYVILILLEINVSPGINPTLQPCSSCLASHESEIYFICISAMSMIDLSFLYVRTSFTDIYILYSGSYKLAVRLNVCGCKKFSKDCLECTVLQL